MVNANSHKGITLKKIKNILRDEKLDFLFIDGDHTYEGAKKDFEMYQSLVKENGIIALHDIAKSDVKECKVDKFWEELKKKYKGLEIINDKNQGWGGVGVVRNKAP